MIWDQFYFFPFLPLGQININCALFHFHKLELFLGKAPLWIEKSLQAALRLRLLSFCVWDVRGTLSVNCHVCTHIASLVMAKCVPCAFCFSWRKSEKSTTLPQQLPKFRSLPLTCHWCGCVGRGVNVRVGESGCVWERLGRDSFCDAVNTSTVLIKHVQ